MEAELRERGLLAVPGCPRPRLPTYEDVEALPFLKAVINVRTSPVNPVPSSTLMSCAQCFFGYCAGVAHMWVSCKWVRYVYPAGTPAQ